MIFNIIKSAKEILFNNKSNNNEGLISANVQDALEELFHVHTDSKEQIETELMKLDKSLNESVKSINGKIDDNLNSTDTKINDAVQDLKNELKPLFQVALATNSAQVTIPANTVTTISVRTDTLSGYTCVGQVGIYVPSSALTVSTTCMTSAGTVGGSVIVRNVSGSEITIPANSLIVRFLYLKNL